MAVSTTGHEFRLRMKILATAVLRNTLKAVKSAAIAADQTAVVKTPVDTGRARLNWVVGVGSMNQQAIQEPEEGSASDALNQARSTIEGYKLGKGGIFISNSVPYIIMLDGGSSAQAPSGMTAAAIQAAERRVGKVHLLKGF